MQRLLKSIVVSMTCAVLSVHLHVCAQQFSANDIVWVNYQGEQKEGMVVRQDESGVLVRFKTPDGKYDPAVSFQSYFTVDKVSRKQGETEKKTAPVKPAQEVKPAAPTPVATALPDGPPLTQKEILDYLKVRIGNDPWGHPDKPEIVQDTAALIRKRGVDFRWDTFSDFANTLRNSGGNESTIPFAIQANFGPPAKQEWFMGKWDIIKIGGARRYAKDGALYEELERGANAGSLMLNKDGSFVWDTASGVFRGKWRAATVNEMTAGYLGGDGLVLPKTKSGQDWIVSRSTNPDFKGDSIDIRDINYRQTVEYGGRQ